MEHDEALASNKTCSLPLAQPPFSTASRPMVSLCSSNLQWKACHQPYYCSVLSCHFVFPGLCAFGYSVLPEAFVFFFIYLFIFLNCYQGKPEPKRCQKTSISLVSSVNWVCSLPLNLTEHCQDRTTSMCSSKSKAFGAKSCIIFLPMINIMF